MRTPSECAVFAGDLGLPVVISLQHSIPHENVWYGGDIEVLERAMKLCPKTVFIGPAQSFWAEISGDEKATTELRPAGKISPRGNLIRLFEHYPNLYCDISAESGRVALSRDPNFTVGGLQTYCDRILFARDNLKNAHLELLHSYNFPKDVLNKIFYQNAQRLIMK